MRKISGLLFAAVLILSGCMHGPARHQFGSYSDAEKYYAQGKYKKAIDAYADYIEDNPDGNLAVIAQYYIAKSHAMLGENAEAKSAFEKIASQYPDMIWAELSKEQLKNLSASQS